MSREIVFTVFPDFQILDLTGPLEVFSQAERMRPGSYTLRTVSLDAGQVIASCGLSLLTEPARVSEADTLVVAGGRGVSAAMRDDRLSAWIGETARRVRRITSVCSGAFLLAQAGVLDGRLATTH